MITVLLADDQPMLRAGFRSLLELAGDITVVGEAGDGPEAVRMARLLRPDVVCMDVRMPGGDGLTATRDIVATLDPAPAVLVLTTYELDDYVFGALEAGASGFLLKDADLDTLLDAIRRLAAGHGMVDHTVTRRVIVEFARRRRATTPAGAGPDLLTTREAEIVRLLAHGLSNAEIAAELTVEVSTVKSHLSRAMTKIGARDRVQTVIWAYRCGLLPLETPP
ncbi:DNA-binding response regulator [Actinoplanes philippinensis]|uniref:DNA-binding response regulator, NarL/FixJ family, contains REC and HTH domains n=1 Tax=Actinoplanes philippinensis TaxID=35752 RepID=A0A1I2I6S8_9ACTN|nr:response regulator transcription factor [Actinoplanes philippinensis]GIE78690.1 DNA-binding response regulator [Actinoplanes philippinensis]SFF36586.1 DNA-binding response regulator, NarL/FixJ family, contains REC and HTH domains [Actinoplanes philippinensis]